MLDAVAAAGTVSEVRAKIQALVEAGARHVIVMPASRHRVLEIAEYVAHEITPSVAPRDRLGDCTGDQGQGA